MNVTVRSMKLHGGAFGERATRRPSKEEIETENVDAVRSGAQSNLDRHIRNMSQFGMPVIVSVNRFASDTDAELDCLIDCASSSGAAGVCLTEVHAKGGAGGAALAKAVVSACQDHIAAGRPFNPLFNNNTPIEEKALRVATRIYGADGINIHAKADRQLKQIKSWGYGNLPVCMAKTQYSL